jgi:hypothetical protein
MDTLNMWIRYQKYAADRTMYKMTLGQPYTHHADTPLNLMQDEIGLHSDPRSDILWQLDSNRELDFIERLVRRVISQEVAVALNLPLARNTPELIQLSYTLKSQRKEIESYFNLKHKSVPLYYNEYRLPGIPDMVMMPPALQKAVYDHISVTTIELTLDCNTDSEWLPEVTVSIGSHHSTHTIARCGITETITIQQPVGEKKNLLITLNNQNVKDAYFYAVDDVNYGSTQSVTVSSIKINCAEIATKGDYIKERSRFIPIESIVGAENHRDSRNMYTNGVFVLDLHFPVLNDVINFNTTQSADDIRNDNQALHELKEELVKYNAEDVDKWLELLNSNSH